MNKIYLNAATASPLPRFATQRHSRKRLPGARFWQLARGIAGAIAALLLGWVLWNGVVVWRSAAAPVDAYFVLGGSIQREMFVAEQVRQTPEIPVLISQGSPDPCIRLIFERSQASIEQVWLEKCAQSTFDNFFYSIPILKRWNTHHLKLVTSASHLPRALWMAQILLGSHGIWVDLALTPETGVPGNQESRLKTALDLTRSVLWAIASQVYQPNCADLQPLASVDMVQWQQEGFRCEHQADL